MKRRTFLRKISALGLGLAASNYIHFACNRMGNTNELFKKWIWITPEAGLSDEIWRERIMKLKAMRIHGVLVQIYSSHKAWYNAPGLPVQEALLERLVKICNETGIEIHAWMWTMPNNNPHYIENHPDWYAVNGNGKPAHTHPAYVNYYRFMCPNHPEVREFLKTNVGHLASMQGLDGVHLDYVRLPDVIIAKALQSVYKIVQDREYPEFDYCYCPICRQMFKAQTGIDPLNDLKDPSANVLWRQFRYNSITSLVNDVLAPEVKKHGKEITAAVFPNWESVRQEWFRWNLDGFFPMLYHNFYDADIQWIGENLSHFKNLMATPKPVYSGLFIPALTPEQLEDAIHISLKSNASGISLFAFHNISEQHWDVVCK